jgi:hypothetical protein
MSTGESKDIAAPSEAVPPSESRPSRRLAIVLIVAAAALGLAYWLWSSHQSQAAEDAAARELQEIGALVVKDSAGRHVASVNLSTLQSPDALSKALQLLPALRYLTSLDASRTSIGDDQLEGVGQLSSLNSLSLIETSIGDAGARHLSGLTNLEALHLASTQISGEALSALSGLTSLRVLDLSATKVAGNLAPLAKLPQLEWLVLRSLTLDDDALQSLADCQSLRRLTLEESKFAKESADALRRALPELQIDR